MRPDALARDYLALALAVDRHVPGLVDAYFGPPELKAEADAGEPAPPAELLARARELEARAAEAPPERRPFLTSQATALVTTCRVLSGEELDYLDEVEGLFGIRVERRPEAVFEAALADLDAVLPGAGDLAERRAAWRRRYAIPAEARLLLLEAATAELRSRASALVALPRGESVELALVEDKPWRAYNWYLGELTSRIEVNVDRPLYAHELPRLVAHEAYPGHHTERALKEEGLYRGGGRAEHAIVLTQAPESLLAEGIAEHAWTFVLSGAELAELRAELGRTIGVAPDPEVEAVVDLAEHRLRHVLTNVAVLMHRDGASEAEAFEYFKRFEALGDEEAAAGVRFVADPLWRAYPVTYASGRDLLAAWLDAAPPGERTARFVRALAEPLTPAQLLAETFAGSA